MPSHTSVDGQTARTCRLLNIFAALAALAAACAAPPLVQAAVQPPRTFVSSYGNDTNPCSRTQPCRTFTAAVNAVAGYGDVVVLDSGGYGPVTLTKSVNLLAEGVYAGISVASGQNGIAISAGDSDRVNLKGLTITGNGGQSAINVASGGFVGIDKCTVFHFLNPDVAAIAFNEAVGDAPTVTAIRDTSVTDCTFGFEFFPKGNQPLYFLLEHVSERMTSLGIRAVSSFAHGNIVDYSVMGATSALAIHSGATVELDHCRVTLGLGPGSVGLYAFDSNARIRVSNSSITGYGNGILQDFGGVILSMGNNVLRDNAVDGSFTSTDALQ